MSSLAAPTDFPVNETGVAARAFVAGTAVTAGENARLWTQPGVITGKIQQDVAIGANLSIINGPIWGRVRRDTDIDGW